MVSEGQVGKVKVKSMTRGNQLDVTIPFLARTYRCGCDTYIPEKWNCCVKAISLENGNLHPRYEKNNNTQMVQLESLPCGYRLIDLHNTERPWTHMTATALVMWWHISGKVRGYSHSCKYPFKILFRKSGTSSQKKKPYIFREHVMGKNTSLIYRKKKKFNDLLDNLLGKKHSKIDYIHK